jgi:hypothetical protein
MACWSEGTGAQSLEPVARHDMPEQSRSERAWVSVIF